MKTFIKDADAVVGAVLRADAGFTCLADGDERTVQSNQRGERFIECCDGRHYLAGQKTDDGHLSGLTLATH